MTRELTSYVFIWQNSSKKKKQRNWSTVGCLAAKLLREGNPLHWRVGEVAAWARRLREIHCSYDKACSILSRLGAAQPRNRSSLPGRAERYFPNSVKVHLCTPIFAHSVIICYTETSTLIRVSAISCCHSRGYRHEVAGGWIWTLRHLVMGVKNWWSQNSTVLCALLEWCLIRHSYRSDLLETIWGKSILKDGFNTSV